MKLEMWQPRATGTYAVAVLSALALAGCADVGSRDGEPAPPPATADAGAGARPAHRPGTRPNREAGSDTGMTIVAVADIACDTSREPPGRGGTCQDPSVARLAARQRPTLVLLPGDIQYPDGTLDSFRSSFDRGWGRFGDRMVPAPGNHEYGTPEAAGYFEYFGTRAGPHRRGWYALERQGWLVVSLNSNCRAAAGCDADAPQAVFLEQRLASAGDCSIVMWHHPRFSSGRHGADRSVDGLWRIAARGGADIALWGHDHHYERFAPLSASGRPDSDGTRAFVVGTGGKSLYPVLFPDYGSERRVAGEYGVLVLKLRPAAYSWRFVTVEGETLDRGSGSCSPST